MCPDYRTPYILEYEYSKTNRTSVCFALDTNICLDYDYYCKKNNGNKKTVRMTWLQPHMSFRL